MERKEHLQRRDERITPRRHRREDDSSVPTTALSVVGGIALLGVAALLYITLPDIKRYIKISTM